MKWIIGSKVNQAKSIAAGTTFFWSDSSNSFFASK
jgi:hypothetical protein